MNAINNPDESQSSSTSDLKRLESFLSSIDDTNLLQTALSASVQAEDFRLASLIRDQLTKVTGASGPASRLDWGSLTGIPVWLSDRLERLGFRFPTEIQKRSTSHLLLGQDASIQSETGSGKTLSYLVPCLARMSYPPETYPQDLRGPQAIILVPTLELGVQVCLLAHRLFGGSTSNGQPGNQANMFTYSGPRGIQVRGLLNREEVIMAKETRYLEGTHLLVATPSALVDVCMGEGGDEDEGEGDVESLVRRRSLLDHLKILCVDEFDECLKKQSEATMMIMANAALITEDKMSPQVVLVGATLTSSQMQLASIAGWIKSPVEIKVGGRDGSKAGSKVPSSLKHRFVVTEPSRRLAVLVKMLRQDLADAAKTGQRVRVIVFTRDAKDAAEIADPLRTALWNEHSISLMVPPGTPSPSINPIDPEAKAGAAAELAESSPFSATDPIASLLSFRDMRTTLLLCTGDAARGLDLPSVSHVYSLSCPEDSSAYLHRAGRAGRIGNTRGGVITTLVTSEEVPLLAEIMVDLSLTPTEQDDANSGSPLLDFVGEEALEVFELEGGLGLNEVYVDKLRKGLDDVFNLL